MKKRQRIEYLFVCILMVSLFLGSIFFTNYLFKKELVTQQEEYLEKKGQLFLNQIPSNPFEMAILSEQDQTFVQQFLDDEQERITLLDAKGNIFYDSSSPTLTENRQNRPEIHALLSGASFGSALRKSDTLNKELLYVAIPVKKNGKLIGILRIAEETTQFSQSIQTFRRYLFFTLGILFSIITLFILFLLRQKNEPLMTVLPVLKRIINHPDETRSIIQQSTEWSELYETVNHLSQQMSQTYRAYTSTEEQFQSLLNELMIGIFIVDKENQLQMINPKMLEILGEEKNKDEALDKNYLSYFKEPVLIHLIHQAMTEKSTIHQEIRLKNADKETILDLSLRYFDKNANDYHVLGIAYDLTRVRQLETMQKDFVSNVSHELKTPVTSLLGFTETLLDGAKEEPETLTYFLEIMQKDAKRLQQLIQEILQLSNDGKHMIYFDQEINLYSFIQEILNSYQKVIEEKSLIIAIQGKETISFVTKYELLYPILKNLIENAIQYSPDHGTIKIDYQLNKEFVFSIKDNGLGISAKDQERIFERFYRVDKARSRHSGGTGLGLSIVRNYAELLGGHVSIESHLGLGSLFIVRLPIVK